MNLRHCFVITVFAVGTTIGAIVLGGVISPVFAASDTPKVSEKLGKPLTVVQGDLKGGNFKKALEDLNAADEVANKTDYDKYIIEQMRLQADINLKDNAGSIRALKVLIDSQYTSAEVKLAFTKNIAELSAQEKNYPEAIDYANRYYKLGGTDEQPRLIIAQSYYLQNDFANAEKAAQAAIQASDRAGKAPDANTLDLLLSAEVKTKDTAGEIQTLQRIVQLQPSKERWAELISFTQRKPGFADRLELDVDRLMLATGTLDGPGAYMDMAQVAIERGFPGEAKTILDKGFTGGILGKGNPVETDRQKRLQALAVKNSTEDLKTLDSSANDAMRQPNGLALVKLGEAYASYGQYDKAINYIQQGIQKAGLKYPEDAKLHLGLVYMWSGNVAKAREIFKTVGGTDGTADLAQLWIIQSTTKA